MISQAHGCDCPRSRLCSSCVRDTFAQLRGVAACRGEVWADAVAARLAELGAKRPREWPPFAGRVRAIAMLKIEDLAHDTQLREQLAAEVARWAARRWVMLAAATEADQPR